MSLETLEIFPYSVAKWVLPPPGGWWIILAHSFHHPPLKEVSMRLPYSRNLPTQLMKESCFEFYKNASDQKGVC